MVIKSNGRTARALAAAAALLVVVGMAACSGSKGQTEPAAPVDPPAEFVVDGLAGATVVPMPASNRPPAFSQDCCGGAHPAVLMVPDDWAGMEDRRWVWVTAVDGSQNEGGIYQNLPQYPERLRAEPFELHGHPAIALGPKGDERPFVAVNTSVSMERANQAERRGEDSFDLGDKRGLLITGPSASLDELRAIAEQAREAEPHWPIVEDPPNGWRVMATLTAAQAMDDTSDPLPVGVRGAQVEIDAPPGADSNPLTVRVYSIEGDAAVAEALTIKGLWSQYDPDRVRTPEPFSTGEATGWCTTSTSDDGFGLAECWFTVKGRPFFAWVDVQAPNSSTPIVQKGADSKTSIVPTSAPPRTKGVEAAPQVDPDPPSLVAEPHEMLLEVIDSIRVIG